MKVRALGLCMAALLCGSLAASDDEPPQFVAIVVGVSNYNLDHQGIRQAASRVADRLEHLARAQGYKRPLIVRVFDPPAAEAPDDASRECELKGETFGLGKGRFCRPRTEHILSLLEIAKTAAVGAKSTFVFYFHGHGAGSDDASLVLKASGWQGFGIANDIRMKTIERLLHEISAGRKIVILDACRVEESGVQGPDEPSYPDKTYEAPADAADDPIFLFSTAPGKPSFLERIADAGGKPSWGGGYFSVALSRYLDEILTVDDSKKAHMTFADVAPRLTALIQDEGRKRSDPRAFHQSPRVGRDQSVLARRLFPEIVVPTVMPPPQRAIYVHAAGRLVKDGRRWLEFSDSRAGTPIFEFEEAGREVEDGKEYVYLVDHSRLAHGTDAGRPLHLRVPVGGGWVQWSFPNPFAWRNLFLVKRVEAGASESRGATAPPPTTSSIDPPAPAGASVQDKTTPTGQETPVPPRPQ